MKMGITSSMGTYGMSQISKSLASYYDFASIIWKLDACLITCSRIVTEMHRQHGKLRFKVRDNRNVFTIKVKGYWKATSDFYHHTICIFDRK